MLQQFLWAFTETGREWMPGLMSIESPIHDTWKECTSPIYYELQSKLLNAGGFYKGLYRDLL